MIASVVNEIKSIVQKINPNNLFECDEARMINVKIDTVRREQNFVYLEEPTRGFVNLPYRGFNTQTVVLRIFFCKFEPMHNDAYSGTTEWSENSPSIKRITIRDEIEETMVRPFLWHLRNSDFGRRYPTVLATLNILYPRSRFDANEVSVGLEFNIPENICLDDYKPNP